MNISKVLFFFFFFFAFNYFSGQGLGGKFTTFKGDFISSTGKLSLSQTIHSNSFTEKDSLNSSNAGFTLMVGRLACGMGGGIWASANANIGVKHTRTLAQKFLSNSTWSSTIPAPMADTKEIFSHYQIGDYLLLNNTGFIISGEVSLYGFYLGLEAGAGLSKMKSGFVNNDSQRLSDAGYYYDISGSFGYTFRYFKIFANSGISSFEFNSVKWRGPNKNEKDFSSLRGVNAFDGFGLSIVYPFSN
jgi:hypothetical protein